MKIGIIGHGSFGTFAAGALTPYADILTYDEREPDTSAPFEAIASADVIILAVPLSAYEVILKKLKALLHENTLIVDICSVKVPSRNIVLDILKTHPNILISHPLFGPQSAANGLNGHDIIVTNVIGEKAEQGVVFLKEKLGLNVHEITAEEHDHIMAYVHALTFFVARGLSGLELPVIPFKTPSFAMLQALIDLDHKHSDELFSTIQKGNPYAADVRKKLINELIQLDKNTR